MCGTPKVSHRISTVPSRLLATVSAWAVCRWRRITCSRSIVSAVRGLPVAVSARAPMCKSFLARSRALAS